MPTKKIIRPNSQSRAARAAGVQDPKPRKAVPSTSSSEAERTITPIDLNAALTRVIAERAWGLFRRTGHPLHAWEVIVGLLKNNPSEPLPAGPREFLMKFGSEMIEANEKPHQVNAKKRLAIAEEVDLCFQQDRGAFKVRGIAPRPRSEIYRLVAARRGSTPKEVENIVSEFGLTRKRKK